MKKLFLSLVFIGICGSAFAQAPDSRPGCAFNNTPPTLASGQQTMLQCDNHGSLNISGSISAETAAVATAAAPTYVEGTSNPLSMDLNGGIRITGTINASSSATATAAAPTYVEGTDNALSQNLSGQLRVLAAQTGGWTVAATQSGTWNINNITGTITLPTGAATVAKQPALGTAGTASSDVLTVQGITSMTPLLATVTGTVTANAGTNLNTSALSTSANQTNASQKTQIVDGSGNVIASTSNALNVAVAGSIAVTGPLTDTQLRATPVPISGTVTANQGTSPWITAGGGTAGSAATGVSTIQGIASMTPVQVSQATASNLNATVVQGTAANLNATVVGSGSAGTANVGVVTVQGIAGMTKLLVTPDSVALPANQSVNISQVNGTTSATGSGNATGAMRVELPTNGTGVIATVGTVTTLTGTTTLTPGTGAANLGKAEDAGHASGDTGVAVWSVRNDALGTYATDNDYQPIATDNSGRTLIIEAPTAAMRYGAATITASTSDTSIIAASGSGSLKTYVKACQIANTGSSTTLVTFKNGSGGSTLGFTIAPTGGGSNIDFPIPLVTSANTAFYATGATSTSSLYIACQGYLAP